MATAPSILVVDDDPSIRMLCRLNLELDGYRVHEAGSIEEARSVLGEADVLLLDVHVGGEDGIDFLADVRRNRPDLPVALLTGTADRDVVLRAGADAVVGKPFTLDELRQTVERLVGRP